MCFRQILEMLDQAEVQDFDPAAFVNYDIGWLDVSVHDTVVMRFAEGFSDRSNNFNRAGKGKRAPLQQLTQSLSLNQLHHDVGLAFDRFAIIVNGCNVWMAEARGRARFAQEPGAIMMIE